MRSVLHLWLLISMCKITKLCSKDSEYKCIVCDTRTNGASVEMTNLAHLTPCHHVYQVLFENLKPHWVHSTPDFTRLYHVHIMSGLVHAKNRLEAIFDEICKSGRKTAYQTAEPGVEEQCSLNIILHYTTIKCNLNISIFYDSPTCKDNLFTSCV